MFMTLMSLTADVEQGEDVPSDMMMMAVTSLMVRKRAGDVNVMSFQIGCKHLPTPLVYQGLVYPLVSVERKEVIEVISLFAFSWCLLLR